MWFWWIHRVVANEPRYPFVTAVARLGPELSSAALRAEPVSRAGHEAGIDESEGVCE
jgi:hypothetical protein